MVEGEVRPGRAASAGRVGGTGWGGSIATAIGVAAAVSAAQLGLGYGLEIIGWQAGGGELSSEAWLASLAWATWIAATSTFAGAMVAERMATGRPASAEVTDIGRQRAQRSGARGQAAGIQTNLAPEEDRVSRGLWRLVLAAAAGLGGSVTVALSAVPARLADPAETSSPQTVAAGYAILGVLVGMVIAVAALAARAVAANVIATAAWLWVLAVVAVVDGVLAGAGWDRVPLAFWVFTDADPGQRWGITAGGEQWFGNIFLPDAGLAAGAALVIGALAALPAARRGDHPVGVAVSGAVGPLVVAAAYLLAQPDLSTGVGASADAAGAEAVDISRHLVAPYLVVTGLIGSLLISAVRPRSRRRTRTDPEPEQPDEADPAHAEATVPSPRQDEPDLSRTS